LISPTAQPNRKALLGMAALAAGPALAAPESDPATRALGIFAEACLAERPGFSGSPEAFDRLGLARPDGSPFHRSGDGAIRAVALPAGEMPDGVVGSCSVTVEAREIPDLSDRFAALLDAGLAPSLTRHDAPEIAAGTVMPDQTLVWTWREDDLVGKAVWTRDADRALGLSVVMAPPATEDAQ